jgi:hypothetical protein
VKFQIEQIALMAPTIEDRDKAARFLEACGLTDWICDRVHAIGNVKDVYNCANTAQLWFNYQAQPQRELELELLAYESGPNWLDAHQVPVASHIGMHCTEGELEAWDRLINSFGIRKVQDVWTQKHERTAQKYHYAIYDTRALIGVDMKFIVRVNGQA